MLLTAIALIAQTSALPAGTAEAARTCAAIEFRNAGDPPSLADSARSFHFVFLATRENGGTGRMLERVQGELDQILARVVAASDDMTLRDQCLNRFPQVSAAMATLPADPFDRAVTCVAAVATIRGLADSLRDTTASQRWLAVGQRLERQPIMTNAEYNRRGIMSSEAAKTNSDRLLQASLDLGNTLKVATSCEAAFPA